MLNGEFGPAKKRALEHIVSYATALNAPELCEITKAQLFVGAYPYLDVFPSEDVDEILSEMILNTHEKCRINGLGCFAQTDAGPFDLENWRELGIPESRKKKHDRIMERFTESGITIVNTCASYMSGFVPLMGEHYVSTESHALLLMNSLWGACANADSIETSICSAICGRTPRWGMHVRENRKGTHIFEIRCAPESVMDWDLLGYVIGKQLPANAVPVITGHYERPEMDHLKSFFASMATTGGPELCLIVGISPEAMTLDQAVNARTQKDLIAVTREDIDHAHRQISSAAGDTLDHISLGCPHYSLAQIQQAARFLGGKKVHPETTLHIWTAPSIKFLAEQSGLVRMIEDSGAYVLTGSCPLMIDQWAGRTTIAFDSAKQIQYVRSNLPATCYYGSMTECLQSALTGRWEAGPLLPDDAKGIVIAGRGAVPGVAEGPALITPVSIQGWSGLDPETGVITEKGHPFEGKSIHGKVLVLNGGKGSTGWATHFHELRVAGISPLAFVFPNIDSRTAAAAALLRVPVVTDIDRDIFALVKTDDIVCVDGTQGTIRIKK
ncbi:MAG: DUF521 domain-containing protein [Deltaproteobacteria bacterium]|nr:DUF521 domain-containing protein [Deltaproteobacteria bacterium]